MKIMALDLGDVWTGTALSDNLQMLAKPYKTVKTVELTTFLTSLITEEKIVTFVVGYPKTLQGRESDQTRKIVKMKEELEQMFPIQNWILWDERLTSKQASVLQSSKHDKQKLHSIAAAIILETYLMHLTFERFKNETIED
jgi:putative Holliday junction resolvase